MPASLERLPTELLRLIIELAVPPESLVFTAAKRRREALMTLATVNKHIHAVVKPILRGTALVESFAGFDQLTKQSHISGQRRVQTVIVLFDTDGRRTRVPSMGPFFAKFPSVRHASLAGVQPLVVNVEIGHNSFLSHIESLSITDCTVQSLASIPLGRYPLVRLALDRVIFGDFQDFLTPDVFPALRFLRVRTTLNNRRLLLCAKHITHQVDFLQLACSGLYSLDSSTLDELFVAYRNILDRTLFQILEVFEHVALKKEVRLFCCPRLSGAALRDHLEELARGPRGKLEVVFIPRNIVKNAFSKLEPHPDLQVILLADVTMAGGRPIWVDSEDYDFVLPEFEQYLKEKQLKAKQRT